LVAQEGSIQYGITGGIDREKLPLTLGDFDVDQLHRLRAFDLIVGNIDRHGGNVIWTKGPGGIRPNLIDNGLAFHGHAHQADRVSFPKEVPVAVTSTPSPKTVAFLKGLDIKAAVKAAKEAGMLRDRAREMALRIRVLQEKPEVASLSLAMHRATGGAVVDTTALSPLERGNMERLIEDIYGHR
jgi:hypothetical protein